MIEYLPEIIAFGAGLNAILPTQSMGWFGRVIEVLGLAVYQGRNDTYPKDY